ncbi:MAG: hypothetical protein ACFBRM_10035 [Pikeienuella sp.]
MPIVIIVVRALFVAAAFFVVYLGLAAYFRWATRKTLEDEHAAGVAPALSREDYVAKGLAAYERSWERKALYGIFLLPFIVIIILGVISLYV